ncbi:hypothetical protein TNCT_716001 [Trichonephila clavata]|uniref:Uncharacterized protein n=1 Tax=Trichonephila clavata TaxID=2740835 RepID=A0A8X6LCU6_TRICU|nr:hypothetical protein TNCT_716001 [Trichonephila clavata]
MSPIEAIRFHENNFLLEDNFMGVANASINPTHNQIYHLRTTVKFHDNHLWAVLLVTLLMQRNHPLSSSKEIIFIDSTSSRKASSSIITILLSATKVGALPLAYPEVFMNDDFSRKKEHWQQFGQKQSNCYAIFMLPKLNGADFFLTR